MFLSKIVGMRIRALCSELILKSNHQFRHECLLLEEERLGAPKRISLSQLRHGKVSIVNSLSELHRLLHGVEQVLFRDQRIEPGYELVAESYIELCELRLIIAAEKYKDGIDLNTDPAWKTYAYGIVEVDQYQIDKLRAEIDKAEMALRDRLSLEPVDKFRIGYLHSDLRKIGIPVCGISSPQPKAKIKTDVVGCCYFKLNSELYIRVDLEENTYMSEEQKRVAHDLILEHEKVIAQQASIFEDLKYRLLRAGYQTNGIKINRSNLELAYDPKRFIAVDTVMGILEVRTQDILDTGSRIKLQRILVGLLNFRQIKVLNAEDIKLEYASAQDLAIEIDDMEEDVSRPHSKGKSLRLRKRLLALIAGVSLAVTGVANELKVVNELIDQATKLSKKLGIELQFPPVP